MISEEEIENVRQRLIKRIIKQKKVSEQKAIEIAAEIMCQIDVDRINKIYDG